MFDTKIAIVVRDDLAAWQRLNVTAFLTSGLVGAHPGLLGADYEDARGNVYNPLMVQPIVVLEADRNGIMDIYRRAMARGARISLFIDDMFTTGHDEANRAAVRRYGPDELPVAGLALRESRGVAEEVTRGARLHP